MRHPFAALLALILLAGCGTPVSDSEQASATAPSALEEVAIARGLVDPPGQDKASGIYAVRFGNAADRLCIAERDGVLRFQLSVRFGEDEACTGRGTAVRRGGLLDMRFDGAGGCRITASFDGARVAMPGTVEQGCARHCKGRASLVGVTWTRDESAATTYCGL